MTLSKPPASSASGEEISALRRQISEMQRRLSELTGEMEMGVNPVGSPTDAFLTMDSEWRFTYLNEPAERMLAQTKESLMGRVAWEAFPEAAGSVFQRQYQRALDERRMVAFEAFFHPLSTWFHIRAYPPRAGWRSVSRTSRS